MVSTLELAANAFQWHTEGHPLTHYTGILSLHGYARLALVDRAAYLAAARAQLLPFVRDEREFHANFTNYYCGGNGTAFLLWQGDLPEAEAAVRHYAEDLITNAPRDDDGIFSMPNRPRHDMIWIDVVFAVTPFLLFAGLAYGEDSYIEEACQQTRKMIDVLRDPANGLLHQARGFVAPGHITKDHWSRGNGWGIYALAELVNYLPDDDPRRAEAARKFVDLVEACLQVQDDAGMWHQEMTDLDRSYVETSGTGLILYALGVGIECDLLPDATREALLRGLRGYLDYIRLENGSVYHTCRGNLSPGDGSILAYKAVPPVLNDPHAFGPVTLAFGQAAKLGIESIT